MPSIRSECRPCFSLLPPFLNCFPAESALSAWGNWLPRVSLFIFYQVSVYKMRLCILCWTGLLDDPVFSESADLLDQQLDKHAFTKT